MNMSLQLNETFGDVETRPFVHENSSFFSTASVGQLEPSENQISSGDWGPKRDPLYIVIPITIAYIFIFVSGVAGNISTCVVIFRNKSMHTATNYYLFSLAVSDLLLLVSGLPPEICFIWSKYPYIFGEVFCILQGFAAETSANATVLTITAFTVERYVAICHPFLSHTLSKLSRAIKFIVAIWVIAMCLAIPQAMAFGIYYEKLGDGRVVKEHYVCTVTRVVIPHAFEISTVLFFITPMTVITILYILIGLQLQKSTAGLSRGGSVKLKHRIYKPVVTYTNSSKQAVLVVNDGATEKVQVVPEEDGRKNYARNAQATKHVVKMLVAVVVAFFICWAPFHAQRLLAIYGAPTSTHMITVFGVMTYVSGLLYYLSTSINPLLYHIISYKFREAFKETFKRFFRRGRGTPGGRCYSTLSGRSSSQVNSQSNTDSCSRQSSLRYLEAEMARLHESNRPLVVSFRRPKSQSVRRTKHVSIMQADCFAEEAGNADIHESCSNVVDIKVKDCPYVQINHLEPTHHCPLKGAFPLLLKNCIMSNNERNIRCLRLKPVVGTDTRNASILSKSCTMPHMADTIEEFGKCEEKICEHGKISWSSSEANITSSAQFT